MLLGRASKSTSATAPPLRKHSPTLGRPGRAGGRVAYGTGRRCLSGRLPPRPPARLLRRPPPGPPQWPPPGRSVAGMQDPSASGRRPGRAGGRVANGIGRRCPSGSCPRCGVQLNWLICAFTYLAAHVGPRAMPGTPLSAASAAPAAALSSSSSGRKVARIPPRRKGSQKCW